jgi:predicted aspartyl protease
LGKAGKELVAKGVAEPSECASNAENRDRKAYSYTPTSNNAVLIGTVTLETIDLEVDPVTGELKKAKTYLL